MIVPVPKRVAVYFRVSTGKQEDGNSLPDQRTRCADWAAGNGCEVIDEFSDATSSITSKRAGFTALIDRALAPDRPYDALVVHSLSRIFRNSEDMRSYRNLLSQKMIEIISIRQEFGDDAG